MSDVNNRRRARPIPETVAREIASALLAVDRAGAALRAVGMSWADLAVSLGGPQQPALPLADPKIVPLRQQEEAPPAPVRWVEPAVLLDLITEIEQRSPPSLGERSRKFLGGLRELAATYDAVKLSAKQDAWLRGLAEDAGITEHAGLAP